jgi:hypothetical protein
VQFVFSFEPVLDFAVVVAGLAFLEPDLVRAFLDHFMGDFARLGGFG